MENKVLGQQGFNVRLGNAKVKEKKVRQQLSGAIPADYITRCARNNVGSSDLKVL